ncbi:MAG: hypothetical protein Q6J33_04700 [Gloeomargarita sp. DG_2_bins_126]
MHPVTSTVPPPAVAWEVREQLTGRYRIGTPDAEGRFWILPLNLSLGLWRGEPLGQNSTWLRWWNGTGTATRRTIGRQTASMGN